MPSLLGKRKRAVPVDPPRYIEEPNFGPPGNFGGTYMHVILGPAAAKPTNYGSKTSAKSIPSLMRPLHDRDPDKWVAGHLLNDNLGGDGKYKRNLTPLTKTANRNHATHEGRIKLACDMADLYHRMNPNDPYWYGIRYTVKVAKLAFGGFAPYDGAPSHIILNARLVRQDKATGAVSDVPLGARPFKFRTITDEEIHNRDEHLV